MELQSENVTYRQTNSKCNGVIIHQVFRGTFKVTYRGFGKADFMQMRIREEAKWLTPLSMTISCPMPTIKLKPTAQVSWQHCRWYLPSFGKLLWQSEGENVRRICKKDQKKFLRKLSPEVAKEYRDAFWNTASRACSTTKEQPSLLFEVGLQGLPVVMMLLEVTANAGQKIVTLIDLAFDTNYTTHRVASSINLRSEEITLVVHGIRGMKTRVTISRDLLKIWIRTPRRIHRPHQLVCCGLGSKYVKPKKAQMLFPDIPLKLVRSFLRMERQLSEKPETPNPLTWRELLSQVSGLYYPLGLVTPAKHKSAILVLLEFIF